MNGGSTSHVEPPAYNPYAAESMGGSTYPLSPAHIGGMAFSTGSTTNSQASSGGTSGASTQLPPRSNVRSVSGAPIASGTSPGGTSAPASTSQTAAAAFVNQPVANAPYQQQESPTALFGSQGYRLDAFFHISREIFVALDRSIQPVGTQMIEASKMRRFRELSGNAIPPYYESHVLPLYCAYIRLPSRDANIEHLA